jgi:hypothetical protein
VLGSLKSLKKGVDPDLDPDPDPKCHGSKAWSFIPLGTSIYLLRLRIWASLKSVRMRYSVLELENLSEDEQYRGKKVYGVSGVELGAWREAYARKDKYWIFGGLKHRVTYILSFLTGQADVHWDWDFRWVVSF